MGIKSGHELSLPFRSQVECHMCEPSLPWWSVLARFLQGIPIPDGLPQTAILVTCIEFARGTVFSGNGTHAGVIVQGLSKAQQKRRPAEKLVIFVVCGYPSQEEQLPPQAAWVSPQYLQVVLPVPVSTWRNLDWSCCWREVACGAATRLASSTTSHQMPLYSGGGLMPPVMAFCIDWSGYLVMREILQSFSADGISVVQQFLKTRVVFLNFRVFGLPWWESTPKDERLVVELLKAGDIEVERGDAREHLWCALVESEALLACSVAGGLATYDNSALAGACSWLRNVVCQNLVLASKSASSLLPTLLDFDGGNKCPTASELPVLMPPIREEIRAEATAPEAHWNVGLLPLEVQQSLRDRYPNFFKKLSCSPPPLPRRLLLCGVRLSSEKEPLRFVRVLDCLRRKGVVFGGEEGEVLPLLFGSPADPVLADEVYRRAVEVTEGAAIIVRAFITPRELCALFRISALNFHPCDYDAFALTITEAAACGCVSLIAHGRDGLSKVGATRMLPASSGMCVAMPSTCSTPLADDEAARIVKDVVANDTPLESIASKARAAALHHTDTLLGEELLTLF